MIVVQHVLTSFRSSFAPSVLQTIHNINNTHRCLKKYCDCFNSGIQCTSRCKCNDCKNGKEDDNNDDDEGSYADTKEDVSLYNDNRISPTHNETDDFIVPDTDSTTSDYRPMGRVDDDDYRSYFADTSKMMEDDYIGMREEDVRSEDNDTTTRDSMRLLRSASDVSGSAAQMEAV